VFRRHNSRRAGSWEVARRRLDAGVHGDAESPRTLTAPTAPDGQNGKAIGVEITAPSGVPLERLNRALADLGETPLSEHDYLPVRAA
jgi:hypothetical protein